MPEQGPDAQEGVVYPDTLIEMVAGRLGIFCLQGGEAAREAARGLRGVIGVAGVVLNELGRRHPLDEEGDWPTIDWPTVEDDRVLTLDELFEEFGESNLEELSSWDLGELVMAAGSILAAEEHQPRLPSEEVKKVRELGFEAACLRVQQILELEKSMSSQQVVSNTLDFLEAMRTLHESAFVELIPIISNDTCMRRGEFAGVENITDLGKLLAGMSRHKFSPEVEYLLECIDYVLKVSYWHELERQQRQQAVSKEPVGVGDGSVSV